MRQIWPIFVLYATLFGCGEQTTKESQLRSLHNEATLCRDQLTALESDVAAIGEQMRNPRYLFDDDGTETLKLVEARNKVQTLRDRNAPYDEIEQAEKAVTTIESWFQEADSLPSPDDFTRRLDVLRPRKEELEAQLVKLESRIYDIQQANQAVHTER
jgi:prefoldin subunit 5